MQINLFFVVVVVVVVVVISVWLLHTSQMTRL
jgi:hypothetical protein